MGILNWRFQGETEAQLDKLRQEFMADDTEAGMIQAWLDEHEGQESLFIDAFKGGTGQSLYKAEEGGDRPHL